LATTSDVSDPVLIEPHHWETASTAQGRIVFSPPNGWENGSFAVTMDD